MHLRLKPGFYSISNRTTPQ